MSVEHRDVYEDAGVDVAAYERAQDAEIEQREWERDDTRMIPKPQPRYRASAPEWQQMHEAFAPATCYVCGGAWESLHHVYPRGQGGDDVTVNLAPLCGSGTTGCHGLVEARDREARAKLRQALSPAHVAYIDHKLGKGRGVAWLDRNYALEEAA